MYSSDSHYQTCGTQETGLVKVLSEKFSESFEEKFQKRFSIMRSLGRLGFLSSIFENARKES